MLFTDIKPRRIDCFETDLQTHQLQKKCTHLHLLMVQFIKAGLGFFSPFCWHKTRLTWSISTDADITECRQEKEGIWDFLSHRHQGCSLQWGPFCRHVPCTGPGKCLRRPVTVYQFSTGVFLSIRMSALQLVCALVYLIFYRLKASCNWEKIQNI